MPEDDLDSLARMFWLFLIVMSLLRHRLTHHERNVAPDRPPRQVEFAYTARSRQFDYESQPNHLACHLADNP